MLLIRTANKLPEKHQMRNIHWIQCQQCQTWEHTLCAGEDDNQETKYCDNCLVYYFWWKAVSNIPVYIRRLSFFVFCFTENDLINRFILLIWSYVQYFGFEKWVHGTFDTCSIPSFLFTIFALVSVWRFEMFLSVNKIIRIV